MELPQQGNTFFAGLCMHCRSPGYSEQPLQRCGGCQLVAYCSRDCQKDDRDNHKYICKEFPVVGGKNALHTTGPWEDHIAGLLERAYRTKAGTVAMSVFQSPWVCNTCHEACRDLLTVCKCAVVSYCSKGCYNADMSHKKNCDELHWLTRELSIDKMQLAYPGSLVYALQLVSTKHTVRKLFSTKHTARKDLLLEDLPNIVVHIVTSNNLLDSVSWDEGILRTIWEEGFAHHFPKLKQLHLVFIMQGKDKPSFHLTNQNEKIKCEECEAKGRVINYSFIQTKYHMFFSSEDYTKPNVVAVYGNTQEMSASEEEAIHSEISYRNMAYSHDTEVVLLDATEDLVTKGVKALNAAQPVELLIPPQMNMLRGSTLNLGDINDKSYFACLKRD